MKRHASWIVTGLILAFLAVASVIIVEDVINRPDVSKGISTGIRAMNSHYTTAAPEIVPGASVGQTLRATEPNLSRIEVRLGTYERRNTAPLLLSIQEYPSTSPPLRTIEAQPETILNNLYHVFAFPPIADSSGKMFLLTLESPQGTPGNAFTAWVGECDCYPEGTLFLQGERQPQLDLTFRVGYENPPKAGVLRELVNRMSQYKPWFFKGAALSALGLLSLAFIILAVGSFTSSLLNDKDARVSWAWVPVASTIIVAVSLWFVLR